MLPEKQKKAYRAFYDSARHNEYFDEKTTILLHLAIGIRHRMLPLNGTLPWRCQGKRNY